MPPIVCKAPTPSITLGSNHPALSTITLTTGGSTAISRSKRSILTLMSLCSRGSRVEARDRTIASCRRPRYLKKRTAGITPASGLSLESSSFPAFDKTHQEKRYTLSLKSCPSFFYNLISPTVIRKLSNRHTSARSANLSSMTTAACLTRATIICIRGIRRQFRITINSKLCPSKTIIATVKSEAITNKIQADSSF